MELIRRKYDKANLHCDIEFQVRVEEGSSARSQISSAFLTWDLIQEDGDSKANEVIVTSLGVPLIVGFELERRIIGTLDHQRGTTSYHLRNTPVISGAVHYRTDGAISSGGISTSLSGTEQLMIIEKLPNEFINISGSGRPEGGGTSESHSIWMKCLLDSVIKPEFQDQFSSPG